MAFDAVMKVLGGTALARKSGIALSPRGPRELALRKSGAPVVGIAAVEEAPVNGADEEEDVVAVNAGAGAEEDDGALTSGRDGADVEPVGNRGILFPEDVMKRFSVGEATDDPGV